MAQRAPLFAVLSLALVALLLWCSRQAGPGSRVAGQASTKEPGKEQEEPRYRVSGAPSSPEGRRERHDGATVRGASTKPVLLAPPPVVPEHRAGLADRSDGQARRDRSERARTLNYRLEAKISELRERLTEARGEERSQIERDLALLEKNRRFRQRLAMTAPASSRRAGAERVTGDPPESRATSPSNAGGAR